jgi:hypothetical protein
MTAKEVLTQEHLDGMGCDHPGCDCQEGGIVLHAACHMDSPTWAAYQRESAALTLQCAECGKTIATIAVADTRGRRLYEESKAIH